jgi:hypothetical protein
MTSAANSVQHGGDHYKSESGLQHWDICSMFRVGYLEGGGSKYGYRWRKKNGLEDLLKCEHFFQKILEMITLHDLIPNGFVPTNVIDDFVLANAVQPLEQVMLVAFWQWRTVADIHVGLNACQRLIRMEKESLEAHGEIIDPDA